MTPRPLEEMGPYGTVVIDPPWPLRLGPRYDKRRSGGFPATELPYGTMSLEEIAALPVPSVLAADAIVYCWTVDQYLWDTREIFEAWGLTKQFFMAWQKPNGMQRPNRPKSNVEYVVVGTVGRFRFDSIKAFWTGYCWPRRAHSQKPDEFYELVARVSPVPRLDAFARSTHPGFDAWGSEIPGGFLADAG